MTLEFMDQVLNFISGTLSFVLLIPYLDRLRLMAWKTHLWRVVGMHLSWALWLGWVAFHGLVIGDVDGAQMLALIGAAMWLAVSHAAWPHNHPPEETESGPVPLGMVGEQSHSRLDA